MFPYVSLPLGDMIALFHELCNIFNIRVKDSLDNEFTNHLIDV